MFANYHTHTHRCGHAAGADREYVEAAIKAGIKVLGFSDHAPYIISDDYYGDFRVPIEKTGEYVEAISALREEYKNDIKIHIGFEIEYYPTYFERTLDFLSQFPYEYLILGQHHARDGVEGRHLMYDERDDAELVNYVDTVIAGISTGKFTYVAHPDVIFYGDNDAFYREHMTRLCRAAKEANVPLEINCLGAKTGRCYPSERFFKIAGEVGNKVVIGIDAHHPKAITEFQGLRRCEEILRKFEIIPLRDIELVNPKI